MRRVITYIFAAVVLVSCCHLTHAERDTIRNIHLPGFYKKTGVWALQQILVTG